MANPNPSYGSTGENPASQADQSYVQDEMMQDDLENAEDTARRESIEAGIEELRLRISQAQAALQSVAGDMMSAGKEAAASLDDSVRQSIERQPYTAVLIAALVGFVIGSVNAQGRH